MIEEGTLEPAIFESEYRGLESTVKAMQDLAARKVWGKAVILVEQVKEISRL
jgi:NADPH:quinone reductase